MIDRGLAVEYDGKTKKTISWFEIYKSKNPDTNTSKNPI